MSEWDDVADDHVPVCCPNCFDDYGVDEPLINPGLNQESVRLTLQIVLYGQCTVCGESIACVYTLQEEPEDFQEFQLIN